MPSVIPQCCKLEVIDIYPVLLTVIIEESDEFLNGSLFFSESLPTVLLWFWVRILASSGLVKELFEV